MHIKAQEKKKEVERKKIKEQKLVNQQQNNITFYNLNAKSPHKILKWINVNSNHKQGGKYTCIQ